MPCSQQAWGSILPEQHAPASLQRVLDVGCDTGGWLIELAQAFPLIEQFVSEELSLLKQQSPPFSFLQVQYCLPEE
jgi:tRNA G46 methylase TrmB